MVHGIVEFRNFNIIMERVKAIMMIKKIAGNFSKYPNCGLKQAKEIYEELSQFVQAGKYCFDNSSSWDEKNYTVFLEMLKKENVIYFDEFDEQKEKEEAYWEKLKSERQEAFDWKETLTPQQQHFIDVIVASSSPQLIAG